MSDSLAAELLADLNDSENEEELEESEGVSGLQNGQAKDGLAFGMEIDDADDNGEDDEDMKDADGEVKMDTEAEDEEVRKAKIEKMQLGGVQDVRSVAGLVKVLEPILEVSAFSPLPTLVSLFCSQMLIRQIH